MTMPVMEPDLDALVLERWARTIDDGPFSSLCWGERIAFENPEAITLLGALAAWTDRVRLVTTVVVPQLHDPVMLAKALATGDMLSGGRLTVGLGVVPVGPAPAQTGGPQLLVGTMGPKTVQSAAAWADGLAGTTLDLDTTKQNELYDVARTAWAQAGKPKPLLATSFWFALGDGDEARAQVHRHLRRYMNWIPAEYVDAMAPTTGWTGNEDELSNVLKRFDDIGTDEIHLIPTSSDVEQVRRVADVVKDFG
jgi:alkanesulfonate monooxygenase SsuD/methylene tetrahydromethanopterin reductase-like flavin-dependent oxidoreductase (luciferase family)